MYRIISRPWTIAAGAALIGGYFHQPWLWIPGMIGLAIAAVW